jgi:cold shock protein
MFKEDRGYGFIKPDDGSPDTFFHITALKEGEEIAPGVAVTFETGPDPKSGRTRATVVDRA